MDIKSLVVGTFISQVLIVFTKVIFLNYLNLENAIISGLFFVLLAVISIAIVRRMGILNLFELIFLLGVWFTISLVVDLLITSSFTGREVYAHLSFWATYLVILLAVFVFHKKSFKNFPHKYRPTSHFRCFMHHDVPIRNIIMLLCFVLKRSSQQFSFAYPCAKLPYRQRAVAVALYKPIPYIRCLPEFGSHPGLSAEHK